MSLEIFQKFYDSTNLIIDQLSILKANHCEDSAEKEQRACLGAIKKICEDVHAQREECIIHFDTICAEALTLPINKELFESIKTLESVRKFLFDKLKNSSFNNFNDSNLIKVENAIIMKCSKSVESITPSTSTTTSKPIKPTIEEEKQQQPTLYSTFKNEHIELSPIQEISSTDSNNTSSSPVLLSTQQPQQQQQKEEEEENNNNEEDDDVGGLSPILKSENEVNEIDAESEFLLIDNDNDKVSIPIIEAAEQSSATTVIESNIPPPPPEREDDNEMNVLPPPPQQQQRIKVPIQFNSPDNRDCNKPMKIIHKSSPSPLRQFKPKIMSAELQRMYEIINNNNNIDPLQRYEVATLDTSSILDSSSPLINQANNNNNSSILVNESNNINNDDNIVNISSSTTTTSNNEDSLTKSFLQYSKNELQEEEHNSPDSSFDNDVTPSRQLLFNESPSKSNISIDYNNITVNDVEKINNIGESIHQSEEYMKYIHNLTKDINKENKTPIKDKRHLLKKRSFTPQPTVFHPTTITPKKEVKSAERSRSLRKTESPIKSPNKTKKFSPTKTLFQSPRPHPSFISPDKTKTQQQKRRECQDLIKEINNQLEVWEQKVPRDLLAQKWIKSVMKRMEEFKEDISIPRGFLTQMRDLTDRLTIKKVKIPTTPNNNKKLSKITEVSA